MANEAEVRKGEGNDPKEAPAAQYRPPECRYGYNPAHWPPL